MEDTLAVDMSAVKEPFTGTDNCLESVAEIAGFARENHPSARIAKGKMEQARYELKTARWQFLPSLSLSGDGRPAIILIPGGRIIQQFLLLPNSGTTEVNMFS